MIEDVVFMTRFPDGYSILDYPIKQDIPKYDKENSPLVWFLMALITGYMIYLISLSLEEVD